MSTGEAKSEILHLTNGELADYLDRKLTGEALSRAESHLADCDYCCEQIILATRNLAGLRKRRWRWAAAPAAAAAVVAGVLILGPGVAGFDSDREPVLRNGGLSIEQAGEEPIEVLAPAEGSVLARDSLHFAWRSIAEEAFYSFTMTDAVGDVIWEGTTNDTALKLGSRVMLKSGERYFWYVDALFGEGRSASTGVREFTAAQ